jgi:hypothetical protein
VAPFGPFETEVKKASIHLVRTSAFAGVHPRKAHLLLTIKAAAPIPSGRIVKTEQVSGQSLAPGCQTGRPRLAWLRTAYDLVA